MRDPDGDRNILYLDCINIKILVVISYYNFARCCPGGIEKIQGISVLFLTNACDSTVISK